MIASQIKDTYFLRNVIGVSGVEFAWGLGLPIVLESTFLQLFIKNLGATNFMIGLIPVFFFVGNSVFALISSYYTAHLLFKKKAVILLHVASGISLVFFGLFLMVTKQVNQVLIVFFISYGMFSIFIGMTVPVWMNYLVHIFSAKKSVSGIAYMNIAQSSAKLIGSLVIARIVDRYAFSIGAASYVFLGTGLLFSLGSLFFLVTREISLERDQLLVQKLNIIKHTMRSVKLVLGDKNYMKFLIGDFDFYAVVTIISFYANYATSYRQIDPAIAAGVFVACIHIGSIASNFLLGSLHLLDLKKNFMVSKMLSFIAIMILILYSQIWGFIITSFILGFSKGIRMVSFAPTVKKLSGLSDSTGHFAISPLITLPLGVCLPLISGRFLDLTSKLGADSYRLLFLFCAGIIIPTSYFILKTNFKIRQRPE